MNELGHGPWEKDYQPSGIVNDLAEGQVKAVKLPDGTFITEKLSKSMTKEQEAALKAFPGQQFIHDRCVFRMAYEQAEKDILALIESRLSEIIGDAQPKPALRAELQELITKCQSLI